MSRPVTPGGTNGAARPLPEPSTVLALWGVLLL